MENNEIEIPVPWGHIAAKTWGSNKDELILTVHGLQDNAGSFDRLVQKLPKSYYYVCIDLPSHGKSSHLPKHALFDILMCVIGIKYVVDYLNYEKFIYIGHSLGCHIGIHFSFIYPQRIKTFISLDAVLQYSVGPNFFVNYVRKVSEKYIELENKIKTGKAPQYEYNEALDKIRISRPNELEKEAAKNMLDRMLIPQGNDKYCFSTDQRLKFFVRPLLSTRYLTDLARQYRFTFPHLIIVATNSVRLGLFKQFRLVLAEFRKNAKFKYVEIEGNHDVHMNNPELVAKIITEFLNKKYSKL